MEQKNYFPEIKGKLGFGCMRFPMNGENVDIPQTKAMVDCFMENGFNYFDTAHGYLGGQSETAIRECLSMRYPRESFILTDKLSTFYFEKEEEILPFFEKQLEWCGVEYFDFYFMHAQEGSIYEKYKRCHAYEIALKLKEEGKIKHFGISFHDKAELLEEILNDYPQIEVVQIQLNYVDYEDPSVESRKVYDVCEQYGKPVIVMEPVKGGSLVKLPEKAQQVFDELNEKKKAEGIPALSNAGYAIRFAAKDPNIIIVLSGMSDMAQMKDNVSYMKNYVPMAPEELDAIQKVCGIFKSQNLIPCTGCRYCILDNDCPMDIRIPELFAVYNSKNQFSSWNQNFYYNTILTRDHGKASACIKCGKCEKICPQHLPIRELLETVAAKFEKKKQEK